MICLNLPKYSNGQGACLALNASKWSDCMGAISAFHELQLPSDDEKLPVGTGSNPVSEFESRYLFLKLIFAQVL